MEVAAEVIVVEGKLNCCFILHLSLIVGFVDVVVVGGPSKVMHPSAHGQPYYLFPHLMMISLCFLSGLCSYASRVVFLYPIDAS